jgi:uncharacterized protein YndB with AHSA1/START domain
MTDLATLDTYGTLIEPATLKIERILPGPIERVWAYLTQSELRRKWLAAGDMELKAGASFELVWRNDELTNPPGRRPEGFGKEHRKTCRIIEANPPRKLAFVFAEHGDVSFELTQRGNQVLLTLIQSRLPDRSTTLGVSAGWHAHLDILVARISGEEPAPFWDDWACLRTEYDRRIPA